LSLARHCAHHHVVDEHSELVKLLAIPIVYHNLNPVVFHFGHRLGHRCLHVAHKLGQLLRIQFLDLAAEFHLHFSAHLGWHLGFSHGLGRCLDWFLGGLATGGGGRGWQSVLVAELVKFSLAAALHTFANSVDVAAGHIVELAVVPYELDVCKDFLEAGVGLKLGFYSAEVHWVLNDLGVVEQLEFFPGYWREERFRIWVERNSVNECVGTGYLVLRERHFYLKLN
jgi:hypothetical protein